MLDRGKPYYEIYGDVGYVGARWEQGGRFYNAAGKFLGPGTEPTPTPVPESVPEPDDPKFPLKFEVTSKRRWEVFPQFEGMSYLEVTRLHAQSLRRIMLKNGQKYKSKRDALEWLK